MMKVFLILLIGISFSCTSNNFIGNFASMRLSAQTIDASICGQYRVSIKIYDYIEGDTVESHSWDPGWHGWDIGKPMPDSIIVVIIIETSPYDFENNKPFDFYLNAAIQLKGSSSWDCMNPENPVLSEKMIIVNNAEVLGTDFFTGDHKFENLKNVRMSYIINLENILNETEEYYNDKNLMFILNALIVSVELVKKGNIENKCLIEHYHPVCLESTNTIFDVLH